MKNLLKTAILSSSFALIIAGCANNPEKEIAPVASTTESKPFSTNIQPVTVSNTF
jgi:hypothetical protein